jgi:hypothetical protein
MKNRMTLQIGRNAFYSVQNSSPTSALAPGLGLLNVGRIAGRFSPARRGPSEIATLSLTCAHYSPKLNLE